MCVCVFLCACACVRAYVCVRACVCVCVSVCPSVCVSVCVHDNSKNNGSNHLKIEHIVVYESSSDKFDIGHCPIKVKVMTLSINNFCLCLQP